MTVSYDVIVVGAGTMGAAACAAIARRGGRVLGIERATIPNDTSSHHGRTRVFRVAYSEHADYVPLLREARDRWIDLDARHGPGLYHETGVLYVGSPGSDMVEATAESARRHGIPCERLPADGVRARHPQFVMPSDWTGLFEPHAGYLVTDSCISAFAVDALRAGAHLVTGERVLQSSADAGGVHVRTDRAEYRAGALVLTAGARTGPLLAGMGVSLRVTRQVLLWVWPTRPDRFESGAMPTWAIDTAHGHAYGFPMERGRPGFKVAMHVRGEATDAETPDRALRPEDEAVLRRVIREHLPEADGPTLAHAVCLYTNSPDGHFVIDRHPASERVTVACGFSGHGFKFAPVIGEALADLALEGRTARQIGFLGASRFGRSERTA
ncbi:MAG: N-methyl-L-tryptophan oxidase [Phycisphaerales bacterium]|nr:N-methyl-L-tryptophan oxidase [Phycisphaerales bacterium]